ncbi:diguanylate cyclase/phosphodiesterase with extracellular sensor [Sulfuricurvum kujiense DSM 16994]|uniref:Diguanylate cyclase/phosphodiesterase with extracellular sensor n=1 Tax=Sulfuricurvum kujiense (strain ATCC BAA-921 / DSM 16994 / JCM 11577 / YK-1) TaxID=709032 RepID=E4TZC9_SULKY|nr:GGDEF domain-containing phosphodiesterase [Sulfuricurvum kujiense]ADR34144.1 diguanylate cyclase/phosphodiesterase with extracellular sensor [Sulfuricurvum kujiense DSM 16994]
MNFFKNARLSTKLFVTLVMGTFILFLTVTLITFWIVRDLTLNSQKEKAYLLIDAVNPAVSLSLFLGINDFGNKLSAITQRNEVIALKITDLKGTVFLNYHQHDLSRSYQTIDITENLMEPSTLKPIGSITLTYSGEEFTKTMKRFYILYGWITISVFSVLWLMMIWVNRLLHPITLIAHKVRNFKPGEKITFDFPYTQREFTQITHAFEAMQESVLQYSDEIETINKNLEMKITEQTHKATHHLYYDTLTSLPNRIKLQEDLLKNPINTVAILNIDDFKEINDFFGIDAGDWLLTQIAHWLSEMKLNPYRIGGDEFAFRLKEGSSNVEFQHDIEILLSLLSEKLFMIADETVHVRATVGIAIDSDKPLIHADVALNKARSIKRPSCIYDPSEGIEQQYQTNIAMSAQIRQALVEHRIVCQYQPIVSCITGKIEKYETLVRIQNEDGSLIPPYDFLPIAQKTKLYHHITQEVVYQACHLFADRDEQFSINLSSSDMLDAKTLTTIENILRQTGTANRVIFEILESEGIENFEEVASFIAKMKNLGAKFAVDDFGTGYSNFENILKLNVDILKIDGTLIKSINENPRTRIVVEAIIDFAHRIGIDTVAEFVASEEILQKVTELGINYAQGFHTGKPLFFDK